LLLVKSFDKASALTRVLVAGLRHSDLEEMKNLAMSHHVIMRTFGPLCRMLQHEGKNSRAAWVSVRMEDETKRITHALRCLEPICEALEKGGCRAVVIKSLDHWPDLGSDLDLYSSGDPKAVIDVMKNAFCAELAPRSWGDWMANKWNFIVPELP